MSNCLPNLIIPKTPDFSRGEDAPAPPPPGRTTLITKPGTLQQLTSNRETDVTYALVRGIKEYIEQLQIETSSARLLLFKQVVEVHADYELDAGYPAAAVTPMGETRYDAAKFTPTLNEVLTDDLGIPYAHLILGAASEATVDVQIEAWATDTEARLALVAMLEDAFMPNDWSASTRLVLPHYHGVHGSFSMNSVAYQDDGQSKARNVHRVVFRISGRCPVVKMFRRPLGTPRFVLENAGPNVAVEVVASRPND